MVRRFTATLMLMGLLLGLFVTTAGPVAAIDVYSNEKIAIGVLDGWVIDTSATTPGLLGQWLRDGNAAAFNIVTEKVPAGTTSVDYAVASVGQVTALPGYKELRRDFVNSGDQQSPRLDYLFEKNGTILRAQQVFITHGTDGFVLSFLSALVDHQDYVDEVDAMVYSLTFV